MTEENASQSEQPVSGIPYRCAKVINKIMTWACCKWRETPRNEKGLIVLAVSYIIIEFLFLVFWRESSACKYLVVFLGVALAATIPELATKENLQPSTKFLRFRITLLLVPAIGIAVIQAVGDSAADKKEKFLQATIGDLQKTITSAELRHEKEEQFQDQERKAYVTEEAQLDPIYRIKSFKTAANIFLPKANRLRVRAAMREAKFLSAHPTFVASIMNARDESSRLGAYSELRMKQAATGKGAAATPEELDSVILPLTIEIAYRNADDFINSDILEEYDTIEKRLNSKELGANEVCAEIMKIISKLSEFANTHRSAGIFNYIGNLAMACNKSEQALGYFYDGIAAEPDHAPIYESIAYALWVVNHDNDNALVYAERGLKISEQEAETPSAEGREAIQLYQKLQHDHPEFSGYLDGRIKDVQDAIIGIDHHRSQHPDNMKMRLSLDYAYFSALVRKNEKEAKAIMTALYESNTSDAEFQDSMGLVLLRFANVEEDLERARQLFNQAADNPKAEAVTKQLAPRHLALIPVRRNEIAHQGHTD